MNKNNLKWQLPFLVLLIVGTVLILRKQSPYQTDQGQVQMCHMRVNEKYRVWHDFCHHDDARMAKTDINHIDGYTQGTSTLCKYQPVKLMRIRSLSRLDRR